MTDQLISCDDHMDLSQLPADLWTTRLPASLLDRAPHVEERDGQAVWVCDGKVWGRWDGKPPATGSARPIKALYNAFDRAGIHDPSARRPAVAELRLADMDRDGVATQVIFGPIFQISTDDPVLRAACYRVYNDWLLDFCKAAPDRLIGLPMLPETPEGALAELERREGQGRRAPGESHDRQRQPQARRPGLGAAVAGARGERHHPLLAHHGVRRQAGRSRRRQGGERLREHQVLPGELPRALRRPLRLGHPRAPSEIAHRDGRGRHGMAPLARRGARLPPLAALGGEGVLGRQGRQRPRDEAERAVQAADLRDLPGRPRGDVAAFRSLAKATCCGRRTIPIPTASGPTPETRSSGRCGTCRRRCAAS